jgi:hypothetical protein
LLTPLTVAPVHAVAPGRSGRTDSTGYALRTLRSLLCLKRLVSRFRLALGIVGALHRVLGTVGGSLGERGG